MEAMIIVGAVGKELSATFMKAITAAEALNHVRIYHIDREEALTSSIPTRGDNTVGPTAGDLSRELSLLESIATSLPQISLADIYYEHWGELLYKNWLTLDQWLRELYIKRVYSKLRTFPGYLNRISRRKTVKGLSPVKRNHKYGRK